MAEFGEKLGTVVSARTVGVLTGNKVLSVDVYSDGLEIERKRGRETYLFSDISAMPATNYASPTPMFIYISIYAKNVRRPIDFALDPDTEDIELLLSAFADYLLGPEFPDNLETLDIDLGGLGAKLRLRNGIFVLGRNRIPLENLEEFSLGSNGFYNLKFKNIKTNIAVSPEYAVNIVASVRILNEILARNTRD